ncbi:MAG: type II toxin-antitoxin system mRNA interferase toxin, RelE/StbE family [Patescibacteria group bacterium]|nr:type II toxin-antitoxin system mRNA interferase toxin, RelE/StbE family [Patescibacteria group bacterium]
MLIKVSPRFEKNYKRLPMEIKKKAKEKEIIFRGNPFDLRLKTHKLKGELKNSWAFWINFSYRIKFIFIGNSKVLFLDIGTHEIYNK